MNPKMGLMPVLIFDVREKMKNVLKYDMLLKEEYPVEKPREAQRSMKISRCIDKYENESEIYFFNYCCNCSTYRSRCFYL